MKFQYFIICVGIVNSLAKDRLEYKKPSIETPIITGESIAPDEDYDVNEEIAEFDPNYLMKNYCPLAQTTTCYHGGNPKNPENELYPLCWVPNNNEWACFHRQLNGSCFDYQYDLAMECQRAHSIQVWYKSYIYKKNFYPSVTVDSSICKVTSPKDSMRGTVTRC